MADVRFRSMLVWEPDNSSRIALLGYRMHAPARVLRAAVKVTWGIVVAGTAYSLDDVISLVRESTPARRSTIESDLLNAATELRDYIRVAMLRPRASSAKVALGIAVLDTWHSIAEEEALDGVADPARVAAVASFGIATGSQGSSADGISAIVQASRRRMEASIEPGSLWAQIWNLSEEIGGIIGFRLDTEAARADRLWESLLAFAAPDTRVDLGIAPRSALVSVSAVAEKIRATNLSTFAALKSGLASRQPSDLVAEEIVAIDSPVPDWQALESAASDDGASRIRVWFGTNREPAFRGDPRSAFTNRLALNELFYGVCQVNLPRAEELSGGLAPFVSAWLRHGTRRGRPRVEDYFRFDGRDGFVDALSGEIAQAQSERTGLVFVHGYATNFAGAAVGAAQFSLNVKHRGPTAMFTWASLGRKSAYIHDEAVVDQSRQQLIEFLSTLSERAGLDHVDVVVHSLGNRLFLRSLIEWFGGSPPAGVPLRNLYLGAPDIDQPEFVRDADIYSRAGRKTTLYSSNADSALLASRAIHRGIPRIGLMPPVVTTSNIDTIETSLVDFSRVQHVYLLESSAIRADIFNVQNGATDPAGRANIHSAGSTLIPDYWRIV